MLMKHPWRTRFARLTMAGAFAISAALAVPTSAEASSIVDPINDFLPTYLGPHNGDLDVVRAEVFLTPTSFILDTVVNAAIGLTPGGFYVWGFNRGAGTQGFPVIAPGVLFDRVVIVRPDGTTNVPGSTVTINGNQITATIARSAAAMAPNGFQQEDFTWNLWPRSPAIPGNAEGNISDFAPDNSNLRVTAVPEPSSILLVGLGGLICAGWRRRR